MFDGGLSWVAIPSEPLRYVAHQLWLKLIEPRLRARLCIRIKLMNLSASSISLDDFTKLTWLKAITWSFCLCLHYL